MKPMDRFTALIIYYSRLTFLQFEMLQNVGRYPVWRNPVLESGSGGIKQDDHSSVFFVKLC